MIPELSLLLDDVKLPDERSYVSALHTLLHLYSVYLPGVENLVDGIIAGKQGAFLNREALVDLAAAASFTNQHSIRNKLLELLSEKLEENHQNIEVSEGKRHLTK